MSDTETEQHIVSACRDVRAAPEVIFGLIADPAQQPLWDGNDNLAEAAPGQRVRSVGDVFLTTLSGGSIRENQVVEFDEGRRIAWLPSEPGRAPPGHLWRWELEPIDPTTTRVTHTYDWTQLRDANRIGRARSTTPDRLAASIERLAEAAAEDQ